MKTAGGKPRLWAVDANIAMSQSLRRLLSGVIELADGRMVVPQRGSKRTAGRTGGTDTNGGVGR